MRVSTTIVAAVSLLLLILAGFLAVRSYYVYEGALHYGHGKPSTAKAFNQVESLDKDFTGRSTGFLSYRGQLTYVSIVNPLHPEEWESWSIDAKTTPKSGPMILVWDVRLKTGLGWGSARTVSPLKDPEIGVAWQLPYVFFTVPYWLLVLLFAIMPYRWLFKLRQVARWEREGRCPHCGGAEVAEGAVCPVCHKKA